MASLDFAVNFLHASPCFSKLPAYFLERAWFRAEKAAIAHCPERKSRIFVPCNQFQHSNNALGKHRLFLGIVQICGLNPLVNAVIDGMRRQIGVLKEWFRENVAELVDGGGIWAVACKIR